jgi:hypothetical protein
MNWMTVDRDLALHRLHELFEPASASGRVGRALSADGRLGDQARFETDKLRRKATIGATTSRFGNDEEGVSRYKRLRHFTCSARSKTCETQRQ